MQPAGVVMLSMLTWLVPVPSGAGGGSSVTGPCFEGQGEAEKEIPRDGPVRLDRKVMQYWLTRHAVQDSEVTIGSNLSRATTDTSRLHTALQSAVTDHNLRHNNC